MYCIMDNSCCTMNSVSICVSMSVLSFRVTTYLQSSEWTLSTAYMCGQVFQVELFNRLIINLYKVQTHLAWFLNVCYHHHENKIYRYDEEYKDKKPSPSHSLCVFYAMDGLTYCLMYWQNSIQFGSTLSRNSSPSTPSEWTCLQTDCQYMEFSLVNLSWGMSTLQNKVKHIILNPVKFKITTTTPKICRLKIP